MKWTDIIHLSVLQFRINRMRHMLCFLAVAVGVFAMTLLTGIGTFATTYLTGVLETLGLKGMTVYIQDAENGEALTSAFAELMEEDVESIESATPVKFAFGSYKNGHKSGSVILIGGEADLSEVMTLEVLYGRGISDGKVLDMYNPVVISDRFAQKLFGRENIVGKQFYLTINGKQDRYTVQGVVRDQMGFASGILGGYMPEIAYVQLGTISRTRTADQIFFTANESADKLETSLQSVSKNMLGMQSELAVQNLSGYMTQLEMAMEKVRIFFILLAGFSMIVAAFAIENSMLSTMQEMKDELLLYRIIGFRRFDIVRLIFTQSVGICLTGAAIGIIGGVIIAAVIRAQFFATFVLTMADLSFVLMISILLGVGASVLPIVCVLQLINKERYT